MRSTESNSSLAPLHPEMQRVCTVAALLVTTSRPTLIGNWKVQDVENIRGVTGRTKLLLFVSGTLSLRMSGVLCQF